MISYRSAALLLLSRYAVAQTTTTNTEEGDPLITAKPVEPSGGCNTCIAELHFEPTTWDDFYPSVHANATDLFSSSVAASFTGSIPISIIYVDEIPTRVVSVDASRTSTVTCCEPYGVAAMSIEYSNAVQTVGTVFGEVFTTTTLEECKPTSTYDIKQTKVLITDVKAFEWTSYIPENTCSSQQVLPPPIETTKTVVARLVTPTTDSQGGKTTTPAAQQTGSTKPPGSNGPGAGVPPGEGHGTPSNPGTSNPGSGPVNGPGNSSSGSSTSSGNGSSGSSLGNANGSSGNGSQGSSSNGNVAPGSGPGAGTPPGASSEILGPGGNGGDVSGSVVAKPGQPAAQASVGSDAGGAPSAGTSGQAGAGEGNGQSGEGVSPGSPAPESGSSSALPTAAPFESNAARRQMKINIFGIILLSGFVAVTWL